MNSPWTRVVLCASAMLLAACATAPSASAPAMVPDAPSSNAIHAASTTLQPDEFDAPAAISIAEAQKAADGAGHAHHGGAASPADPHAGHGAPASTPDPHAGHGASASTSPDPHAGHGAPATTAPDPHAGHGRTESSPSKAKVTPKAKATPKAKGTPKAKAAPKAKASNPRPRASEQVVYTCPMHPEVKSGKPGNCPKCGMTLVKKEK